MASLRKRRTSKYWVACIQLADGTRRQFSTGLENKADAMAAAMNAESAVGRLANRPHALRASLDRIADEYAHIEASEKDPAAWILSWVAGKAGEVSQSTSDAYLVTAKSASQWLAKAGVKSFSAITERHCREIRDHWRRESSAVNTNKKMKHLRMALTAACDRGLMDKNPVLMVPALATKQTARRQFADAELGLVMGVMDAEWLAMSWLALNTGQRLNDLAILKRKSLDMKAKETSFRDAKTDKTVALPLLPVVVSALETMGLPVDPEAFIFPTIAAMARTTRSNVFRDKLASVGLARDRREKAVGKGRATSELSFHSFRHTATTWLKSAGVSDAIARAIIGHESAAVSRTYTHFDMKTMREAMGKVTKFTAAEKIA